MVSPDLMFWFDLALKTVLTASIVVIVSVTVERSGPFLGALISALPTAAGAAYVILALEHPPDFIAASAIGSAAATAAVSIFVLTYTVLAQRHNVVLSLGLAIVVWLVAAAALRVASWTAPTAFLLNVAVFSATVPLSARYRTSGPPVKFMRSAYDIPVRALSAAIVVVVVTTASYSIGSFASGMFAMFPIVMSCSAVILHLRVGGITAASMFAHSQIAFIGLWLGYLAMHYMVAPVGVWGAYALGLAVCIAWSGILLAMRRMRSKQAT